MEVLRNRLSGHLDLDDGQQPALLQVGVGLLVAGQAGLARPYGAIVEAAALRGVVERTGSKPAKVFQPVRVAIAGTTISPGIFESVALLGRDETLSRIDRALELARARQQLPVLDKSP